MTRMRARIFPIIPALLLALVPGAVGAGEWSEQRLFEHVIGLAAAAAAEPWQAPAADPPTALGGIGYDTYRNIRYRSEAALWRGESRFEAQFFHPGFLFDEPVRIHQLADGALTEIPFDTDRFRYDGTAADLIGAVPDDLGFAGFRLHYPLDRPDYADEIVAFLGASYFRLVGPGQVYGLSARGIAIDTVGADAEEFPVFREFWLVRPAEGAATMTLFARLDGPSVTGAYRFDFRIDDTATAVEVDQHLFARRDIDNLGIAPLTSMFLHGDTSVHRPDDFRPRVHDSDGLAMLTAAGEWLWRPLQNPHTVRVTSLRDREPRGFGLAQRENEFDRYLDREADYQRRPSLWVEPLAGDWGEGGVELVEIPTDTETADNIVAYWAPDARFAAGERRRFRYRLSTFDAHPPDHDQARVVRTRSGWGRVPGEADPPPRRVRRFIVDYEAPDGADAPAAAELDAELDVSAGEIRDLHVAAVPGEADWRVTFLLEPDGDAPADMRLTLHRAGEPFAETWTHVWYPDAL